MSARNFERMFLFMKFLFKIVSIILYILSFDDGMNIQSEVLQNNTQDSNNSKELNNAKYLKEKDGKKESVYMEFEFGCTDDNNPIYIYVSPSCLHCAQFVLEDLDKFLQKYGAICRVIVRLVPTAAKDVFLIKLFSKKAKNKDEFCLIMTTYLKRVLAEIKSISPTKEQKKLYGGSKKDEDMLKFQVVAHNFGFLDEEIKEAIPYFDVFKNNGKYEIQDQDLLNINNNNVDQEKGWMEVQIMNTYAEFASNIIEVIHNKSLDLPLIVRNGKKLDKLPDEKTITKQEEKNN